MKKTLMILICLSLPGLCSDLHAAGISFAVAPTFSKPANSDNTFASELGWSGGLIFELGSHAMARRETGSLFFLSHDLGIIYSKRAFSATIDGTFYRFTTQEIQLQNMFYLWISRVISPGIGFFASYTPGPLEYSSPDGNFQTSPIRRFDYGITASVRLMFGTSKFHWFIDSRYTQNFGSTMAIGDAHYQTIMALIGIRFGTTPPDPYQHLTPGVYRAPKIKY